METGYQTRGGGGLFDARADVADLPAMSRKVVTSMPIELQPYRYHLLAGLTVAATQPHLWLVINQYPPSERHNVKFSLSEEEDLRIQHAKLIMGDILPAFQLKIKTRARAKLQHLPLVPHATRHDLCSIDVHHEFAEELLTQFSAWDRETIHRHPSNRDLFVREAPINRVFAAACAAARNSGLMPGKPRT